jgi:hypothetical protein
MHDVRSAVIGALAIGEPIIANKLVPDLVSNSILNDWPEPSQQ